MSLWLHQVLPADACHGLLLGVGPAMVQSIQTSSARVSLPVQRGTCDVGHASLLIKAVSEQRNRLVKRSIVTTSFRLQQVADKQQVFGLGSHISELPIAAFI